MHTRDLDTFLSDASCYRIGDENAIHQLFLAFSRQKGEELYSDVFFDRWRACDPENTFPFIEDLMEDCFVPPNLIGTVTYLEIACFLYDSHVKTVDLDDAKQNFDSFSDINRPLFCLNNLAQDCYFHLHERR